MRFAFSKKKNTRYPFEMDGAPDPLKRPDASSPTQHLSLTFRLRGRQQAKPSRWRHFRKTRAKSTASRREKKKKSLSKENSRDMPDEQKTEEKTRGVVCLSFRFTHLLSLPSGETSPPSLRQGERSTDASERKRGMIKDTGRSWKGVGGEN
jgi:hypothetical protein